jgi:hypothetical protein
MKEVTNTMSSREQYRTREKNIRHLLRKIENQLDKDSAAFDISGGKDYGYAGSLGHVQESLENIHAFLTGNA